MTGKFVRVVATLGAVSLLAMSLAAHAASVTGVVTNKTTGRPDAGDPVVLLSFGNGMQVSGRTTTDAEGRFTLQVPDESVHLIRVDHQKAAYFKAVTPGTTHVNMTVYDVGAKVAGIVNEAIVVRVEASSKGLRVIQNYFVKNASNPPRTQLSPVSYPVYVPSDAKIVQSAAMGPDGMPVNATPAEQPEKGQYAFIFPLRPGETRFQVTYTLPYNGSFKFTPRVALPTQNLAVMLPKSMTFHGVAFQPANAVQDAQTFLVRDIQPSQALTFSVSGTGELPGTGGQAGAQSSSGSNSQPVTEANDDRPGGGLGVPIDTPDPLHKYKWFILTALAVVLAIAAAFFVRGRPTPQAAVAGGAGSVPVPPTQPASPSAPPMPDDSRSLLAGLKDELFALETERLEGRLSDEDYASQKAALELVMKRTLAKKG